MIARVDRSRGRPQIGEGLHRLRNCRICFRPTHNREGLCDTHLALARAALASSGNVVSHRSATGTQTKPRAFHSPFEWHDLGNGAFQKVEMKGGL